MSSNYPSGFTSGVTIRGLPLQQLHPGEVFWCNSSTTLAKGAVGGSDGNDGSYRRPFATLDYAIGRCTAGRGDIIMLMPNHTETVTSATSHNFDVAGVAIIGLGTGTSRPLFTFTTADSATIPVSAANISISNCRFLGTILSTASCFTVAAAPGFSVEYCDFTDTSNVLGFLNVLTTTVSVNADDLNFSYNRVVCEAATTPGAAIEILGDITKLTVNYNRIYQPTIENGVPKLLTHAALVVTDLEMIGNTVYCIDTATGPLLMSTSATTGSGIIANNLVRSQDPSAALMYTAAAVQYGAFNNYHAGETTALSGILLPAAGADTS